MKNTNQELIQGDISDNLSKDKLLLELKHAKAETFKYVNKFLEVEEKWAFINLLLKKLNSIRQKQELCKTICEGFLELTNSKICVCCLFNNDHQNVEQIKMAYGEQSYNKKKLADFIEKVNSDCCNFLKKSSRVEEIQKYFISLSEKELIIVPIMYSENLLGYLMLNKEDPSFYRSNIHFINIFPEHIALILENISLYQESVKSNKRKIEFLAGISHEFRTPLNSIIGFSEILKSKIRDPKEFKYINNILLSSKHLLTLIQDVIDVSKSQYKILELNYSTFSPKDEIEQIILTLEAMIKEKNINLSYTLTHLTISADVKRFRQLIYNLVSNAVKFNKFNGTISIITFIKDENFFFEVTDTGDGISKKNHEKIFDFFSQVNRSQLKRQLGSGVGLALCKMITDSHGGEISFKSQLKKGSSFWFSLPI